MPTRWENIDNYDHGFFEKDKPTLGTGLWHINCIEFEKKEGKNLTVILEYAE